MQSQDSNYSSDSKLLFDRFIFLNKNEIVSLKYVSIYRELFREIYGVDEEEDGLTQEEIDQVKQSRKQITEGKSKKFVNADEYLKSLDSDE